MEAEYTISENPDPDEPLTVAKLLDAWEQVRTSEEQRRVQEVQRMVLRAERIEFRESGYTDGDIVFLDPSIAVLDEPPFLLVVHPPGKYEAAFEMVSMLQEAEDER